MIKPEVLDAMVAAGCSAEQIAAVVKADLVSRSSNANRQARFREKRKGDGVTSNVTVTPSNVTSVTPPSPLSDKETPPAPPKEINSPPLPPAVLFGASDFESKILEAAGEMIHPHGAIVIGPILSLITAGADLELDVLPAIRASVAKLSQPARSWSYFVPAIQSAFDRRIAAGTWERGTPSTKAQPPPKLTAHQQRHKAAVDAFERRKGEPDDEFAGTTIDLADGGFGAH